MKVEEVKPYREGEEKTGQVASMFDSIAPAYDSMNRAMTFGLCGWWRNYALRRLPISTESKVLDVATGTGDLAFRLLEKYNPAQVTGIDLSPGMLEVAEKKAADLPEEQRKKLRFEVGDCLHLPYSDGVFDVITVAYGVRNFSDLAAGYKELRRVLKPGGTLCVIELSEPTNVILKGGYTFYSRLLIPFVGKLVSGDNRAYSYLPESIAACPQRDEMAGLMEGAGFSECRWKSLTFGVVTIYYAN